MPRLLEEFWGTALFSQEEGEVFLNIRKGNMNLYTRNGGFEGEMQNSLFDMCWNM